MIAKEFDLDGFAIDCSSFPHLGSAGKEIFRALKLACCGGSQFDFDQIERFPVLRGDTWNILLGFKSAGKARLISPSDVLCQAAVDAAMDGATIVFGGEMIPEGKRKMYWSDGRSRISDFTGPYKTIEITKVVAYKLI